MLVLSVVISAGGVAGADVGYRRDTADALRRVRPPGETSYTPPVDRRVIDGFRIGPNPYAAGHRGLAYASVEGEVVRAIGSGVVSFAGRVAGSTHVTVVHEDGLRSSYSYVDSLRVRRGDIVDRGQPLAEAGERPLHLGVRRGTRYLDPARLFRSARAHAVLVAVRARLR